MTLVPEERGTYLVRIQDGEHADDIVEGCYFIERLRKASSSDVDI